MKIKLTKKERLVLSQLFSSNDYEGYPTKIERDLGKNEQGKNQVSRITADDACKKFQTLGFVKNVKKRPYRQKQPTEYYSIDSSLEGYINGALVFLDEQNEGLAAYAYDSIYDDILNQKLVVQILMDDNLIMRRKINIEEESESNELSAVGIPPFKERFTLTMDLPVLSNQRSISDIGSIIDDYTHLSPTHRDRIKKEILEHYESYQPCHLILPIWALINASSYALKEFLRWHIMLARSPYDPNTNDYNVDHLMFRLVSGAINELAERRQVANSKKVHFAYLGQKEYGLHSKESMFTIKLVNGPEVHYDIGFETNPIVMPGPDGSILVSNQGDYWVNSWVK